MRFELVDRIVALEPGARIRTRKSLSLAEEYLSDHFPTFPVMPGVLLLECMVQSAAWLIRATDEFTHSLIWLEEAKNVVYKSFVSPGRLLDMEVVCRSREERRSEFAGSGHCENVEVVKARIWLRHERLADRDPSLAALDRELLAHARERFSILGGGGTGVVQGEDTGAMMQARSH
jgi:3-hydroxyacyl-[acyl-carrier-protein] dehydratase